MPQYGWPECEDFHRKTAGRHGAIAENELRVGLSMGGQNAKISIGKLPGGTAESQKMSLERASVWVARM